MAYRRNIDERYRKAERLAIVSGSDIDQATFLRERIRVGNFSSEWLPLLAGLDYKPAQLLLDKDEYELVPSWATSSGLDTWERLISSAPPHSELRFKVRFRAAFAVLNAAIENHPTYRLGDEEMTHLRRMFDLCELAYLELEQKSGTAHQEEFAAFYLTVSDLEGFIETHPGAPPDLVPHVGCLQLIMSALYYYVNPEGSRRPGARHYQLKNAISRAARPLGYRRISEAINAELIPWILGHYDPMEKRERVPPYQGNPIYRRNADDAYRQAQRRALETGSDADQARFLQEKIRVGETSSEILPLLAYLSYRPAQILLGNHIQIPETLDILSPEDLQHDVQRIEAAIRDAYEESASAGLEALGGGGVENAIDISLEQFYQSYHISIIEKILPVLNAIVDLCPALSRITKFNVRYRAVAAIAELYRARREQGDYGVGHTFYRYWKATNLAFLGNTTTRGIPGEFAPVTVTSTEFLRIMEGHEDPGFAAQHGAAQETAPHWEVLINMMHMLYRYIGDISLSPQRSLQYYYRRSIAYALISFDWSTVRAAIIKDLIPWLLDEGDPLAAQLY